MAADLEFASHALDATGLAWRHLAEKGLIDRVTPVSNAGDLKHRIVSPRAHIARILPKGPFRFPSLTRDSAFDDDFRRSRHLEVNGQAFDHLDRFAADAARRRELIHSHRKRADRSKTDRRIGAENDGGFGGATLGLIFLDVLPHAGTRIDHHSAFTGAFDLNPICSHIPDARFRIAGNDEGGGMIGAGILTHCPHRSRQHLEIRLFSHVNHFLARPALHQPRGHRIIGPCPFIPDAGLIGLEGGGVDFAGAAQDADH